MDAAAETGAAATFAALRPVLTRVAYRMLGSMVDAEDVVQDAFLRWSRSDPAAVRAPEAYLRQVVTRLSLDVLKSARRRRETYVGPWLPEPVIEEAEDGIEDVTLPLLMALERLSPLERAAFLLHDVFGADFDEVAETIGRSAAACRQLASRARTHVRAARPRFDVPRERGLQMAEAFFVASRTGDMAALRALLAADVEVRADGGGKRPAFLRPLVGVDEAMQVHEALARRYLEQPSRLVRYAVINGLPGFVTLEGDGLLQTTALRIEQNRITGVFVVRNPDKLQHLTAALA